MQAPDATVFTTTRYREQGRQQFAVIGISVQGAVVSRTHLNFSSPAGRPVFALVAGRDGYFMDLVP